MTKIVIIGGGPASYEAALVASRLGAQVTIMDRDGLGGSSVLSDCVPSKALIATSVAMTSTNDAAALGLTRTLPQVDIVKVNTRIMDLAKAQSADITSDVARVGITVIHGSGRLNSDHSVSVNGVTMQSDVILIATGSRPRTIPDAMPDGERILSWDQLYTLKKLPAHLVVIGSGITGAEFAFAYLGLGSQVTLISSRNQVLPGNDNDAANVIENIFRERGGIIMANSRAASAVATSDGVSVALTDGRVIQGSHVLVTVGSVPNTKDLGLAEAGVKLNDSGYIEVDRVSRTNVPGIYAAGDCTGILLLASVAAMQGRIAMQHALGESVLPLDINLVSSTIFTSPEIASVGTCAEGNGIEMMMLPLATNARAKMENITNGFIKIFARNGVIVGGVICAPRASELIYPITLGISAHLSVDSFAQTFTVYPSLTGSIAEAARRLCARN